LGPIGIAARVERPRHLAIVFGLTPNWRASERLDSELSWIWRRIAGVVRELGWRFLVIAPPSSWLALHRLRGAAFELHGAALAARKPRRGQPSRQAPFPPLSIAFPISQDRRGETRARTPYKRVLRSIYLYICDDIS
jgi:hypothetical protein